MEPGNLRHHQRPTKHFYDSNSPTRMQPHSKSMNYNYNSPNSSPNSSVDRKVKWANFVNYECAFEEFETWGSWKRTFKF